MIAFASSATKRRTQAHKRKLRSGNRRLTALAIFAEGRFLMKQDAGGRHVNVTDYVLLY